jgi:hypothetical protein
MPGSAKPSPLQSFELNMADAHLLVDLAEALGNFRVRRVRRELREKVGAAIDVPKSDWEEIDCIESGEFFLVLKPGSGWTRDHLRDRSPLLRQAVVAAAAAFESYLADRVVVRIREIMRGKDEFPRRLGDVYMTVQQWRSVEGYSYRWRGITEVVLQDHVREQASAAPSQVGALLSMVGIPKWAKSIDTARKVPSGTTENQLAGVASRRNRIAHEGDRRGHGRAAIDQEWVRQMLEDVESIVQSIDALM